MATARVTEATIGAVAAKVSAGLPVRAVAGLLGLSHNAVTGIVYRLRQKGDPRVPPAGAPLVRSVYNRRDMIAEAFASGAIDVADVARLIGLRHFIVEQRWREIVSGFGAQAA